MDPAQDSFQDWLDGFKKEVDAVVSLSGRPGSPAAEEAQQAFDNWWDLSQDPPTGTPPDPNIKRVETLSQDNSALRVELTQTQGLIAAERAELDLKAARLETQVRALLEQVNTLGESKRFMAEALRKAENAKTASDEELKLERARLLMSAQEAVTLRHKTGDQEAAIAKLRESLAARDGTLEELRRQACAYQDRLITAKELTDADVALLRQELKLYLEEFRIMMNTLRKGEFK